MRIIAALALSLFLLAACSGGTPAGTPAASGGQGTPAGQTGAPAAMPTIAPGQTLVTGQIISTRTNQPIANTMVRLAEVTRPEDDPSDGVYVLDEARSPGGRTDEAGRFVIANIPAGEYVLMISTDDGQNAIVTESSGSEKAKVWPTEEGKVADFGAVRVNFP